MKHNKHFHICLLLLASILIFGGCKIQDKISTSIDDKTIEKSPQIAFINYSMAKDSLTGEFGIELLNLMLREGVLKPSTLEFKMPRVDDLEYLVLDENSQVIMRKYIDNPLRKTVEYVNDDGQLAMKDIEMDRAQFSLRIPLLPSARYISIELYRGEGAENIKLSEVDLLKGE